MINDSNEKNKHTNNKIGISPSLNQGKKFKKYQTKIENVLEKSAEEMEGFTDMNQNVLTQQTNAIIRSNNQINNYSQKQIIDNLRQEYQNTLNEYETLTNKISGNATDYVDRVSTNNPYLNKNILFTDGTVAYVTNQGVAKPYTSVSILNNTTGQNGCPSQNYVKLTIPWSNYTPGSIIPTTPSLVAGMPMKQGQSCGNEGSNVFVNQLLPSVTEPKYIGCYAASSNNNNMTFIGSSPPALNTASIQNGNFSTPVLKNNSYKYITSSSSVPGWYFGGSILLNNSKDWGFPIPYPSGNQCACIQNKSYIYQLLSFSTGSTYTLSFSASGRNSGSANPINIQLYTNLNAFISTIGTTTPTVNSWSTYKFNFTVPTTQSYKLYFSGTNSSGDKSSAIQNISLQFSTSSQGNYSYDDCEQAAISSGYRYFGLQNANTSTGKGYCAVSNSQPAVTQYGTSTVPNKMVKLWSSNTGNQTGNTALLSITGSLQVINSGGQAVYSSPAKNANPANYLGCYGDSSKRAMTLYNKGSQQYSNSQCQQIAQQNGYQYYGLQNSTSGTNAQCNLSNNFSQTVSYGKATNCTQVSDGSWSGGGWSNAVYNTTIPQSNYFLVVQDDGNLVIYRGTGPNDNQGTIWSSQTNGQQQSANPNVVATKGKYGQNWISSGKTLAAGDFIGSNNGKTALFMQPDGNLVLYTYQMDTNCQKMGDGNMGGGVGANAVYDIGKTSIASNMGQLGYIDGDSNLYTYPSSNQMYANTYSTMENIDTSGNDIPGAAFGNATVESCQSACNNNPQCAGFVTSSDGSYCWPKTGSMYPYGGNSSVNSDRILYIRGKQPSSLPIGVSQNTNNMDTITYQNYVNKGNIGTKYGLSNATDTQKTQLDQLQTKMNLLSNQITNLTNNFQNGAIQAAEQSVTNSVGLDNYIDVLKHTNDKIMNTVEDTTGNVSNILKESDITVLQQNYDYLFWSILATGTVLISMNVIKK